jgi:hypothetical protein
MSKENRRMQKRLATTTTILVAALALLAVLPIASASAEPAPWWQLQTGSRPTNLWKAANTVQELQAGPEATIVSLNEVPVACLYSPFCFFFGLPTSETAQQLEEALEGPSAYGAGNVEVKEEPESSRRFLITSIGEDAGLPVPTLAAAGEGASAKVLTLGGSGRLVLNLTNIGDAPLDATETPLTIEDELPEGAVATDAIGSAGVGDFGSVECALDSETHVTCTFEGTLPSYEAIEVEVFASLTGESPVAGAPGEVSVSGGNGPTVSAAQEIKVSPDPVPFGIQSFSSGAEEEGGAPATQAGRHPFQLTATVQANMGAATGQSGGLRVKQPGLVRNLRFPLPAGLVGNVAQAPRCTMTDFYTRHPAADPANLCPDASAVGAVSLSVILPGVKYLRGAYPVFNLAPGAGEPARFGFLVGGNPVIVDTAVDPDDEYRILATAKDTTQLVDFLSSTFVLWGTPGDPDHDDARGWGCVYKAEETGPCERPPSLGEDALLRMPVSCDGPLSFTAEVEPWSVPAGSTFDTASSTSPGMNGCNQVPFAPTIAAAPTSKLAANPSGLDFRLEMPNFGLLSQEAISEGHAKKVEVTLPEGMTLNPSQAEGLATCSPSEYAKERFNSFPGEGCPESSKVGSIDISTPLLEEEAHGSLYVASPYDNPFDSLVAIYLVARIPERGVLVKQAGVVKPNPKTGQLVSTFDDLPQLPFSTFKLHFREGGRSPLITPPGCGTFQTVARFFPWSAKDPSNPTPEEIVTRTSSFTIERGVDGGACPTGPAPFKPGFSAGTLNNNAGSYSPFYMRITRGDGEQDLSRFSSILPPGVVGKLAGVAYCPESGIARALSRTGEHGGAQEKSDPSCPDSSKIGRTVAGAGVGNQLTYVPGSLYLAGPYKGAPLSAVSITPAVAGPFDAGAVVVRVGLDLDPKTAEVKADGSASDPIPHILQGIPLNLRDLRVYVDRDAFTLNATSCEESSARATLWGAGTALLPQAELPVDLSSRYQAANCANLGFKPSLKLKLKGGTARGGHPGLTATYTPRKGDANVKGLVVRLPRSAFLDQAHIRTICTRVQFAADACPKAAQYGYIKAFTPLLDEPLQGPVYLRSSNHKLPDLVFDLHGLVDVEVATRIDSVNGGIRAKVEDSPDAPLSKVVLKMQGAKKGLIINSRDLCGSVNKANVQFSGHNGKQAAANPAMRAQCGKARKGKR